MRTLPDHSLSNAAQIIARLEQIEQDLATLGFERAAGAFYREKREFELEQAKTRLRQSGTVQEREDGMWVELAKGEAYKRYVVAEAAYEGAKAAVRVLETRSSIGQSLLRSMGKE